MPRASRAPASGTAAGQSRDGPHGPAPAPQGAGRRLRRRQLGGAAVRACARRPGSPLAVSRCSCWEGPRRESDRRDEPGSPSRCRCRLRPSRRRSFRTPSRPRRSFGCPHRDMLDGWAALPRLASRGPPPRWPRPAATLRRTARRLRELTSRLMPDIVSPCVVDTTTLRLTRVPPLRLAHRRRAGYSG